MTTAEWICTKCGVTNRRLVTPDADEAPDRCVTCRTRHLLRRGDRPVYWHASAQP